LVADNEDVTDAFSYDGYGMMLGGNPNRSDSTATNLLYCGEYFDTDHQQYYLRSRWYNTDIGRFNRLDPFAGNNIDPQSLHKYLYCHANPVNNIDPSGEFSLTEMLVVSVICGAVSAIYGAAVTAVTGGTYQQVVRTSVRYFWYGAALGAAIYGGIWAIYSLWMYLAGGGVITAQDAAKEGFRSHGDLVRAWRRSGATGEIHHFVQQHAHNIAQFGKRAIYSMYNSTPISKILHMKITAFTNSSTETLKLTSKYGYHSHLYQYIRGLSWEAQYRWGVAMYKWIVEKGIMDGFDPKTKGL